MGRPKKNKEDITTSNVISETEIECAKDVVFAESAPESKLILEAPEVFLEGSYGAIEVTKRSFDSIPVELQKDISEVSKINGNQSLTNTELLRAMSAKLRARKMGRNQPLRRGGIKTNFTIN